MTYKKTRRGDKQHQTHTTFLILQKMRPNYPKPTQTFSSFCGEAIVPVKASTPINTSVRLIIVHYIDISLH